MISINYAFASEPVLIGILENLKQPLKDSINPRVRIIFYKEKNNWYAMKNNFNSFEELSNSTKYYPNEVTWNVVNNGKNIGSLQTIKYTPHWYSDIGIQNIIGNFPRQFLFSSTERLQFPMMKMNYKPLILVSQDKNLTQNFHDSENWHISKLTSTEKKQVLYYLHNVNNIDLVECYRSENHGVLVGAMMKHHSNSKWFYIAKGSSIKFLGSGIMPIAAADLNHNGQTEWIFLYSDPDNVDENANGYVLFYDHFKQSIRFIWSNH